MKGAIIYLIGHYGVGKLTIARAICEATGARLFDNHLVNNVVFSLIRLDGRTPLPDRVWDLIWTIREQAVAAIAEIAPVEMSYVLTNALMEDDPWDRGAFEQIVALAARRGSVFVPVVLTASDEAHAARMASPERAERLKHTDAESAQKVRGERKLLDFTHPNRLDLDTTGAPHHRPRGAPAMTDKPAKKTDLMSEAERDAYHAEKMRKKKEARNRILATKTEEKGLLIVHTGKGKGKSTAAFGMVFRALGHGMRVGVVQFVKGVWETGERDVLMKFPEQVSINAMGEGFTWDVADRQRDLAAARNAWEHAKRLIADDSYDLVLLDELNICLRYDYLPIEEVVEVLKGKPADKHVIVTGRNAKDELIEIADLVTEMTEIKHHFRAGVKAQKGIEF
jgi:cob(I)alamin adenosyltransferase